MSALVIFSNLLVVGPGLIGASLALAAKRADVKEVIFPEGNKKDWEELD